MEKYEILYKKVCRLCLSFNSDEMVPLVDENSKLTSYGEDAETFAQITIENIKAPPSMCKPCLTLLIETKQFIIKCKKTQTYFEKLKNCSDFDRMETVVRLISNGLSIDIVPEPTAMTETDMKPNISFHIPLPEIQDLANDGSTDCESLIAPLNIKTESELNEIISQPNKLKASFKAVKTKTKSSDEVISALRNNLNLTVNPISKMKSYVKPITTDKKFINLPGRVHHIFKEDKNELTKTSSMKSKKLDSCSNYSHISAILGNCTSESDKLSSVQIKDQRKSDSDQDECNTNRSATPTSIKLTDMSCMEIKFDDESFQNLSDNSMSNKNTILSANSLENISDMEMSPVDVKPIYDNQLMNLSVKVHQGIESASPAAKRRSTNINKSIPVVALIKPLEASPNISNPYQCNICVKSFAIKGSLVRHMRQHPGTNKPVDDWRFKIVSDGFECNYCPKTFNTKSAILNHVKQHVVTIKPLVKVEEAFKKVGDHFECNSCQKVLSRRFSILRHVKRHRPRGFICEHCAKSFVSNAELTCHLLYTHKVGNLKKCSECDFTAATHNEMVIHKRLHTGERPFICDHCGLGFRGRQLLRRHLLIHYEKSVQCPKCPVKVCTRSQLTIHDNQAHNRRQLHRCPSCDKLYKRIENVRQHLVKIHGVPREKQGKIPLVKLNSIELSTPKLLVST